MRHATPLLGFSCTSTHTSRYATARFLLHFHTYVGKTVPVNPLKGQYSCHTKFRKPGLSLKNDILWGKILKNQYFLWTLRGFKLIENTMIWWKCWKTLRKLKLNIDDGMSILHHCTASYQRRYHVYGSLIFCWRKIPRFLPSHSLLYLWCLERPWYNSVW